MHKYETLAKESLYTNQSLKKEDLCRFHIHYQQYLVIELPLEWRCVAQALYRNGSSKVLIAGRKGARIFLTRSIRQGCPLAPFLFLFIIEAMSSFFNSQGANLHGLSIPNSRKSLLDSEFADDTMLYLQGNETNLERAQSAMLYILGLGLMMIMIKIGIGLTIMVD